MIVYQVEPEGVPPLHDTVQGSPVTVSTTSPVVPLGIDATSVPDVDVVARRLALQLATYRVSVAAAALEPSGAVLSTRPVTRASRRAFVGRRRGISRMNILQSRRGRDALRPARTVKARDRGATCQ